MHIENSTTRATVIGVAFLEGTSGITGATFGLEWGSYGPDTTQYDTQINSLTTKINHEKSAVGDLNAARPDTQPAIDSIRGVINGQQGQVQALKAEKQHIIDTTPTSYGHPFIGAAVGMTAIALVLGGRYVYKQVKNRLANAREDTLAK